MVSFRHQQFQAILSAVVMTDALSQGQLPRIPTAAADRESPLPVPRATDTSGAIASDCWCRDLVAYLPPTASLVGSETVLRQQLEAADTIPRLVSLLPQALLGLDHGNQQWASTIVDWGTSASVGLTFYQALIAVLNHDLNTIPMMSDRIKAIAHKTPTPLAQAVVVAFEQVLLAHWDFNLSVAQSLCTQSPLGLEGLPLLTGILSASKVGIVGLPITYRQALTAPAAPLQEWLEQRWQGATAATIQQWAQELWRAWLGCEATELPAAAMLAVRPARGLGGDYRSGS